MRLNIQSSISNYEVIIEKGIFDNVSNVFNLARKVLIVSDNKIPEIYINTLSRQCKEPHIFIFKAGEKSKNIKTLQDILKELLQYNFSRKDVVVALGGGVSGDMAAFASSIYKRGIEFYNIPTSLLSMLDSSIGGKTAIDFNGIKNVIGSFYPAKKVLIDPLLLKTLDERQFKAGLVEAIKMAATFDADLFHFIESSKEIHQDIEQVIIRSLQIKKSVVEQDEKESGLRQVLNFGHTVGHGIESFKKGKLLHGECVGIGMLYFADGEAHEKISSLLKKYDLLTSTSYNKEQVYQIILKDKKGNDGFIHCIYCHQIGTYQIKKKKVEEVYQLL